MPRGRPKGSRNKGTITVERMQAELVEQVDAATIAPLVEEKFKNFPPAKDTEKEKKILAEMEHIDDDDQDDEDYQNYLDNADRKEMPFYLRNLPEGSDKTKHIVAAAQAAIILGTSPTQVANQFGIKMSRVISWRNTLIVTGAIGKRDRLSDMLFAYIEQEMKSLLAISMITSDEEWVMRQSASDLAHFIAVKADRLLMLIQAFARTNISQREYENQLKVLTDNAQK